MAEIVSAGATSDEVPSVALGRNVRRWDLPDLIQQHTDCVKNLEKHLAKYLADPSSLPAERPRCKPAKSDPTITTDGKGQLDAISYLEERRLRLSREILEARRSVDQRDAESYAFASYKDVEQAHATAYQYRHSRGKGRAFACEMQKHATGVSIELAPRPQDIIWQNLPMSRATRKNRMVWDSLWMLLLTIFFIGPNILTSVFLSDFSHLGQLWPTFQDNLEAHPVGFGIAQGILAPGVQFLFYFCLPIVFRRILTHSGDPSRTSRERHLTSRLYVFFVINQLIVFSVFAVAVRYVAAVVAAKDQSVWEAMRQGHLFTQLMTGLCNVSTFWVTWQMQQNLQAATDLAQLLPLATSWFQKRFLQPTPRELIELSAPQPIEYAAYYNAYLFSVTVGLCFATLQPIILPITAFFLIIDSWFKTYLVQYVLFTKTESGGAFWRMIINRLLVATVLSNAVVALIVGSQGVSTVDTIHNGSMLYAMIPLPLLMTGFKYYLLKQFDAKMGYIYPLPAKNRDGGGTEARPVTDDMEGKPNVSTDKFANTSLNVKFGHPALYAPLISPMAPPASNHLMAEVLDSASGRPGSSTSTDYDPVEGVQAGYGDSAIYMTPLRSEGSRHDATRPDSSRSLLEGSQQDKTTLV